MEAGISNNEVIHFNSIKVRLELGGGHAHGLAISISIP